MLGEENIMLLSLEFEVHAMSHVNNYMAVAAIRDIWVGYKEYPSIHVLTYKWFISE